MDWHTLNYGQGVVPKVGDAFQKTLWLALGRANDFSILGAFLGPLYNGQCQPARNFIWISAGIGASRKSWLL